MNHDIENECRCEPTDYVRPAGYNGDGSVAALAASAAQPAPAPGPADIVSKLRSLKVLLGADSPEVRGWAPAVQQQAQKVVNEAIAALSAPAQPAPVEPVAWRYVPSPVWRDHVITEDPQQAEAARNVGCEVTPLYAAPRAA